MEPNLASRLASEFPHTFIYGGSEPLGDRVSLDTDTFFTTRKRLWVAEPASKALAAVPSDILAHEHSRVSFCLLTRRGALAAGAPGLDAFLAAGTTQASDVALLMHRQGEGQEGLLTTRNPACGNLFNIRGMICMIIWAPSAHEWRVYEWGSRLSICGEGDKVFFFE